MPDYINTSEDDTSDFEHVLVEFSMLVHVGKYSIAIPMIENRIKHETIDTSIVTFSKPSEFSRTNCDYVIALNFSFF